MKKLLTILAVVGFSNTIFAQLITDNSITVEEAVNEFLLGEGIEAFNITFNGFDAAGATNVQIGSFNGESTVLGMDEGLLIATGGIDVAEGPNNIGSSSSPTTNPAPSDSDLASLIPGFSINDVAVLEFDFIPSGDTVRFNYIWGSEEYPEFVNSSFNDVFGFFISGPGISGGEGFTFDAANIAVIPGTTMPVTIDNLNIGMNSEYYVDNTGAPIGDPQYIQFDGYTIPMQAIAAVECGQVYHIKIALADAGDSSFDSGVFLEKGSFASPATVTIDATPINGEFEVGENDFTDGIVAGCTDARFCLTRTDTVGVDTTFFYIGGSAIPGVQYVPLDEQFVIFPEGIDTLCIDIESIANDLGAQVDSLVFYASTIDPCTGDTIYTSASINVYNEYIFEVATEDVVIDCPTEMVTISAEGFNGLSPYNYVWYHESDTTTSVGAGSTIAVPLPTEGSETYIVEVTDDCGISTAFGEVTVINAVPPGPFVNISPPEATINCVGESVNLMATGSLGQGELEYIWSTGSEAPPTTVTPDGSMTENWYYVTVMDECGTMATDSMVVYFIPLDAPDADAGEDIPVLCAGDEVELTGGATGGATPYSFQWLDLPPGQTVTVSPTETTTYYLQVTDDCGGTSELDSVTVIVPIPDPITVEIPEVYPECMGDEVTVSANATGGTGVYDYEWNVSGLSNPPNAPSVTVPGYSTSFQVTVSDQCGAQGTGVFTMLVEPNESIVVTPAIKPACTGESFTLSVSEVYGGAGDSKGDYTFVWTGENPLDTLYTSTDGSITITNAEPGELFMITAFDECGDFGTASIPAQFIGVESIPDIITANGDRINDYFVVPGSATFDTKLTIMDRWGKVAFESDNYLCDQVKNEPETLENGNCWDGGDKKGEVYYYLIEIDNGACSFQGTLHVLEGN